MNFKARTAHADKARWRLAAAPRAALTSAPGARSSCCCHAMPPTWARTRGPSCCGARGSAFDKRSAHAHARWVCAEQHERGVRAALRLMAAAEWQGKLGRRAPHAPTPLARRAPRRGQALQISRAAAQLDASMVLRLAAAINFWRLRKQQASRGSCPAFTWAADCDAAACADWRLPLLRAQSIAAAAGVDGLPRCCSHPMFRASRFTRGRALLLHARARLPSCASSLALD